MRLSTCLFWTLSFLPFLMVPLPAGAVREIEFDLEGVEGKEWGMVGLSLRMGLNMEGGRGFTLKLARLTLPPPLNQLQGLELDCPKGKLGLELITCPAGTLKLGGGLSHRPVKGVAFTYRRADGTIEATVPELAFAGGRLQVGLTGEGGEWRLDVEADGLDLATLAHPQQGLVNLPQIASVQGRVDLSGRLRGLDDLEEVRFEGRVSGLDFADHTGLRVGGGLEVGFSADGERDEHGWSFQSQVGVERGILGWDPVYIEVKDDALRGAAQGLWEPANRRLIFNRWEYLHPDTLELEGMGIISLDEEPTLAAGRLDFRAADMAPLYAIYLQPLFFGTMLEDLDTAGTVRGWLERDNGGELHATVVVKDANVDDRKGRFGLYDLDGTVNWGSMRSGGESRLDWKGAHFYRVIFGGGDFRFEAEGGSLRLSHPLEIPVLDGWIKISSLELENLGRKDLSGSFQGELTPVSMESLSHAFGWPVMGGSLAGDIPLVRYAEGRAVFSGGLRVKVFDGEVLVHNLSLERPLGLIPKLAADVDVEGIYLEALTSAFSFGRIQGRLDGTIRDLVLEDWQPARFDARFQTPPDDRSRHRISQRAVDNLASLGGAGGALSRTFMRFFDEFSYERLGLACRLENGVCNMDGVAPAEGGYYIVEGGGIPRIYVKGYNRRVDWKTLVERLKNATTSGAPVVK